jgi:hypothetical protein
MKTVELKPCQLHCGTSLFDPEGKLVSTFNGRGESHPEANTFLTREYRKPFVVPAAAEI